MDNEKETTVVSEGIENSIGAMTIGVGMLAIIGTYFVMEKVAKGTKAAIKAGKNYIQEKREKKSEAVEVVDLSEEDFDE